MKPLLSSLFFGLGLATANVAPAAAYPVDCAILLCLAGGWPSSAECSHARAVFIQRITPWPIEPPLQIWNCPMRASFRAPSSVERLFEIRAASPAQDSPLHPVAEHADQSRFLTVATQADVDISDPAFDFVRSIRVFEITYRQRKTSDDCNVFWSVYEGSYGVQGDYTRRRSHPSEIPEASDFDTPEYCRNYSHRSVFVEWRDYEGAYGHEEVHY